MAPGGAVSNTGLTLHMLGIETSLMSKLGDDSFGAELRLLLGAGGREMIRGLRTVPGEHTSYTIILSPPETDRVFLHSTGANDSFGPEDIDYDALGEADLFHFGYPTAMARMYAADGAELAELMRRAKETGITTSLDMSMFDRFGPAGKTDWRLLLARTLPFVDIFLPSLDEILLMLGTEEAAGDADPILSGKLARELLDYGAGMVALKQGQNGIYLRSAEISRGHSLGRAFQGREEQWQNRELWAPSFNTDVVGTTGAGDCAVGGFLAAVLRGLTPEEALIMAVAVGACNVEAADATSGVRSWAETRARVEAGWEQHSLALPGWDYHSQTQVWSGPAESRPA